jgi:orotidine 5'-phosphate decarboxylase subfamily 2
MYKKLLNNAKRTNGSMLCVGLDPDPDLFVKSSEAVTVGQLAYMNTMIIEATKDYAACYKLNLGFYLASSAPNWLITQTLRAIPDDVPVILDGKFGDIENTAKHYAKFAFESFGFDGVTLNPYMGADGFKPFYRPGKLNFILTYTSNKPDIQTDVGLRAASEAYSSSLVNNGNIGFVVGDPERIADMRGRYPWLYFLVPGVGAQENDLEKIVRTGVRRVHGDGLLINVSRSLARVGQVEQWGMGGKYKEAVNAISNNAKGYVDAINSYRK